MRDPYEILGVGRHATEADIKTAFRRLAIQHHPDKNPGDPEAQVRFKEINAAHQILSDPNKRAAFDRYGEAAFRPGGAGGVDFGDFGGLDSIFGDLLGAFGLRTSESGNVKKTLSLTFEESARGAKKTLSYERIDICGDCRGRGAAPGARIDTCSACSGRGRVRYQQAFLPIALERPCSTCRGTGSIPSARCTKCSGAGVARAERTLEVDVPAGIEPGSSRTLSGEGHRLKPQQPPGDLEVLIDVLPHAFFKRSGDDVLCRVPVTFTQAALGGELLVPTLEGKVKLRVPSSTQPGAVLRLRGHGFPHRLRSGAGDQLVEIAVEVPENLTDRAKSLIQELGDELGEEVQPQRRSFLEKLKELF
ncbi:MAG TPA: molecular chaperone DnaJ [Polyangiaceae bacterium]|nr:molecular chaperone DnaJ [Polyangiaceae bacterium]